MSEDGCLTLHTGAKMPIVGLGTWAQTNLGPAEHHNAQALADAVKTAIEVGYRHIDTAWAYKNEKEIGVVLKDLFDRGVVKREDLFITTKLFAFFHNPEVVESALRESLEAMQLDYLDLYLMHGPIGIKQDPDNPDNLVPIKPDGTVEFDHYDHLDTWKALEACVHKGLVRAIGVSNFNSKQIKRIIDNCEIKPAVLQVECHPYLPQSELKAFCEANDIVFTAYAPIGSPGSGPIVEARGGKYPKLMEDPKVLEIAQKYKKTPAQVLIRWAVDRGTIVIPKSTNPARIKQNFDIFDFKLRPYEVKDLENRRRGRLLGGTFAFAMSHPEFPWHEPF